MRRVMVMVCALVLTIGLVPTAAADSHHTGLPSTVSGRVVDADHGRGLPLVVVIAYEADYTTPLGWTLTRPGGRFVLRGIAEEEIALRFLGGLTGHERGWQACDNTVVADPGDACTTSPGDQGVIRLDRVAAW